VVKWAQSFGRGEWTLEDDPVRVFHRQADPSATGRLKPYTWTAQVINWWHMRGDGFSREEALAALQVKFATFQASSSLPRPGRGAPLKFEFASADRVEKNAELLRDMLQRVLGFNPDQCLVRPTY